LLQANRAAMMFFGVVRHRHSHPTIRRGAPARAPAGPVGARPVLAHRRGAPARAPSRTIQPHSPLRAGQHRVSYSGGHMGPPLQPLSSCVLGQRCQHLRQRWQCACDRGAAADCPRQHVRPLSFASHVAHRSLSARTPCVIINTNRQQRIGNEPHRTRNLFVLLVTSLPY